MILEAIIIIIAGLLCLIGKWIRTVEVYYEDYGFKITQIIVADT